MPLKLIRDDITKLSCDVIVNAANNSLLGGGGVDGAIHRAAGPKLLEECRTLGGCETGQAKITRGYDLPAKYVVHTVGPVWYGGKRGEEELLRSCYRSSLALAREYKAQSVAFPLISSGVYGYPKDKALSVAVSEITAFLADADTDMLVYMVIFDRSAFTISEKLFGEIAAYIDDNYVSEHTDAEYVTQNRRPFHMPDLYSLSQEEAEPCESDLKAAHGLVGSAGKAKKLSAGGKERSLDEALSGIDESFSEMLLRKIDEKGMTDAECYKKANIDRKLFSKIRGDKLYKPSKSTALAFAIALELPLEEARDMLMKAGFALSHSNKFDIIVEYFITNGNYNVFEINDALFAFDQALLGV